MPIQLHHNRLYYNWMGSSEVQCIAKNVSSNSQPFLFFVQIKLAIACTDRTQLTLFKMHENSKSVLLLHKKDSHRYLLTIPIFLWRVMDVVWHWCLVTHCTWNSTWATTKDIWLSNNIQHRSTGRVFLPVFSGNSWQGGCYYKYM